jgi:hypothetical protein
MSWNYLFGKKTKCLNLVADDDDDDYKLQLQRVKNIYVESTPIEEPGSSVSIVSDNGLDDRAIEVRSPAGAKDFSSSLSVQTGSEAHPASCTMGTGGPFPEAKARPGHDADH